LFARLVYEGLMTPFAQLFSPSTANGGL
jgi:hypothetical protein